MKPEEYRIPGLLAYRIDKAITTVARQIHYAEISIPYSDVQMVGVRGGNAAKVCRALEAAFGQCTTSDHKIDYAAYGLNPPDPEEQQQSRDFLESLRALNRPGGKRVLHLKNLPSDRELALLGMALPYFVGEVRHPEEKAAALDAAGYPKKLYATHIESGGGNAWNHSRQKLHIDGEDCRVQHQSDPHYLVRFIASRRKSGADFPTIFYSADEVIDVVTDRLMEKQPAEADERAPLRDKVANILKMPIWPVPSKTPRKYVGGAILVEHSGELYFNHLTVPLNLLFRDKKISKKTHNMWHERMPTECQLIKEVAEALCSVTSEKRQSNHATTLKEGEMFIYNDRKVIHGATSLTKADAKIVGKRTLITSTAAVPMPWLTEPANAR